MHQFDVLLYVYVIEMKRTSMMTMKENKGRYGIFVFWYQVFCLLKREEEAT